MSLKNILLDVSSVLGLDIADDDERAYHIEKINGAAQELYFGNDLPGCLREQLFQIDDSNTYQVSLPWYVDKVRGVRFYNTWIKGLKTEDMTPRYHNTKWGNKGLVRVRIKGLGVPLGRDLLDISPLTFTLSEADDIAVTFNIIGVTEQASRAEEAVTILAGATVGTSTLNYKDIIKIEKTDYNNKDCIVTDIGENEVSRIPNHLLSPSYTIVLIRDDEFAPLMNNSFPFNTMEFLYKTKFVPFQSIYDEFPCPNCDNIIFWKFVEDYYRFKPEKSEKMLEAKRQADDLIKQLFENDELAEDLQIDFGANSMYDAYHSQTPYPFPHGTPVPFNVYTP